MRMLFTLLRGVILLRGHGNSKLTELFKSCPSKVINHQIIPKRCHMWKNKIRSEHFKDGVPKNYIMIFNNRNGRNIRIAAACFVWVACIVPMGFVLVEDLGKNWTQDSASTLLMLNVILIMVTAMVFVRVMYRRTMLRIYKNGEKDEFICIAPKWILFQKSVPVNLSNIVPTKGNSPQKKVLFGSVKIKDRGYFLRSNDFTLPKYFNELHGFNFNKDQTLSKK